jgi:acetoacetate decarboxylase
MSTNIVYPPAPWHLEGEAVIISRPIDIETARQFVPRRLRIVPVLPGRTVGALYCARYSPESTLTYHELIVAPALTYAHGKLGFWISHIYVDDPASMAAGRGIWGLPKEMAIFQWSHEQGHARVDRLASCLCEIRWTTRHARLKAPVIAPALTSKGSRLLAFKGLGTCAVTRSRAEVTIPTECPFAALGFDQTRSAILAPSLRLNITAPTS